MEVKNGHYMYTQKDVIFVIQSWRKEKQKKLDEAIKLGFIIRKLGDDGVYTYTLTPAGMRQWFFEAVG